MRSSLSRRLALPSLTVATELFFLSTPAMFLRPCAFFAPESIAPIFVLSAVFWFGVGAVAAARVRRAWLIVVMVIVLFVAMMVLGLVLAIIAMMQSSP